MGTTLNDIARRLGISINTVSKALNNKPQVSEKTRRLVLEAAREMNYTPNESARALVRRELCIAAVFPREPHVFYQHVAQGVRRGARELLHRKCSVLEYPYSSLEAPEELRQILLKIPRGGVDALVLTCSHRFDLYEQELAQISARGIPIFYNTIFGREIPGLLGGVRTDTNLAGKMAAEFMGFATSPEHRKSALLVGEKDMLVHNECVAGFREEAARHGLELVQIYETYEELHIAYELTGKLMRLYPDLGGIYVTSSISLGVCRWFEDHPQSRRAVVIGHDLYPEQNEMLRQRTLSACIFQDQYEYGRDSINMVYEYLIGARGPESCTKLVAPQLVLSCMVGAFPFYDKATGGGPE